MRIDLVKHNKHKSKLEAADRGQQPPIGKGDSSLAQLRNMIVTGRLKPGDRLPTLRGLALQWNVSFLTVQQAAARLAQEGFLTTRGRAGTFVAENPPHLCRYALAFPTQPNDGNPQNWSHFYTSLLREAVGLDMLPGQRFVPYFGVNESLNSGDARALLDDLEHQRLAGVVVISNSACKAMLPVIKSAGIPAVTMITNDPRLTVPQLDMNHAELVHRAIAYLRQRGRRRLAVLAIGGSGIEYVEMVQRFAAENGMKTHSHWVHGIPYPGVHWASNVVRLLMKSDPRTRPDALLIADDHLVEPTAQTLVAEGISVPRDLEIVAQCNFPWPTPSLLPMHRIGFDLREVLRTFVNLLNLQRERKKVPGLSAIPPRFDFEMK